MVYRNRNNRWSLLTMAVLLGGGLLPGTCMIRTKQAFLDGSKSFLTNVLLNPSNFTGAIDQIVGDTGPAEDTGP